MTRTLHVQKLHKLRGEQAAFGVQTPFVWTKPKKKGKRKCGYLSRRQGRERACPKTSGERGGRGKNYVEKKNSEKSTRKKRNKKRSKGVVEPPSAKRQINLL